jgi:hypothetical protein
MSKARQLAKIISSTGELTSHQRTLLADFPSRNYATPINLTEPITNFKYIVIVGSNVGGEYIMETTLEVSEMVVGRSYQFWGLSYDGGSKFFARWAYATTSTTGTFTLTAEFNSWIKKIYGVDRI